MSDDRAPLEILPWGQTAADAERIARKKQAGRRGCFGLLLYMALFAGVALYAWGWNDGRSSQSFVKESRLERDS